jgi:hypothetical protein
MSWNRIALASTLMCGLNAVTFAAGGFTRPSVPADIEVPA